MIHYTIILLLTVIIYMVPLLVFLPFKLKLIEKIMLFFILFANMLFMSNVTGNIGVILLLIVVSIYIAAINPYRLRNICIFLLSYIFNVIINNVCSVIFEFITSISIQKLHASPALDIIYALFEILILYIVSKLLIALYHKLNHGLNLSALPKKTFLFICINVLVTTLLFIANIVAGEQIGYSPTVVIFNTFIFVTYFIISTWTVIQAILTYKKETEMHLKQESYHALQTYTQQVESLYRNMRSFKHDYVNIITTLYGYIEDRDIDQLSEYFKQHILPLSSQLAPKNYSIGNLSNLKVMELKSLVTAKIIYAQEMQIDTTIEIVQPVDSVNTDIIDLSRILGNFLDNAIEAALNAASPKLSFIVMNDTDEVIFTITNTFDNRQLSLCELSKSDFSSKGIHRGIGLFNVSQIIAQHRNLYLDTYIEDDSFVQMLHIHS